MKYLFLIAGLVAVTHGKASSQVFEMTYVQNNPVRLVEMKLQDQFGDEWILPDHEGKPAIIFFLPKVPNREDGKNEMNKVRSYIRYIEERYDNEIQTLFIIEPYRTGLLINRIFQSRLRDETFSIVIDSDAEIINQTKDGTEGLYFWIVDSDGEIIHRSSPGFSEQEWEMIQPTVKHQLRNQ